MTVLDRFGGNIVTRDHFSIGCLPWLGVFVSFTWDKHNYYSKYCYSERKMYQFIGFSIIFLYLNTISLTIKNRKLSLYFYLFIIIWSYMIVLVNQCLISDVNKYTIKFRDMLTVSNWMSFPMYFTRDSVICVWKSFSW